MHIAEAIQLRCQRSTDAGGRAIDVICEDAALDLAGESNCSLRMIYVEAMNLGICPFRYIRNREIISLTEQLSLARAQVAVVGLGGLGGQVLLLLARMGIGTLRLIDFDCFDESNLNRQVLCTRETLGQSKTETAAQAIQSVNPAVETRIVQRKFDENTSPDLLRGADVVVDALDNIRDRFLLEKTAQNLGLPLVHGAVAGFEGRVLTILPGDPGLRLVYGDDSGPTDVPLPENLMGVTALAPAIIGSLQAMEVVKIILGRGRPFRRALVHVDLETGTLEEFRFGER